MDFLEVLKTIVDKEPGDLTQDEIAFLKARAFYLSDNESRKFKEVLRPKKVEATKPVEPEEPKIEEKK